VLRPLWHLAKAAALMAGVRQVGELQAPAKRSPSSQSARRRRPRRQGCTIVAVLMRA
jgi:hypothetical protein